MNTTVMATTLRRLACMPFLDCMELAAAAGIPERSAYRAVAALERKGLVRSVTHGADRLRTTRRFFLTSAGLRRLATIEEAPLDTLLRARPLSAQWRRLLLERLDGVAVIYRLTAAIAGLRGLRAFRWYRALPMDAALAFPDGGVLAVVREGPTADRTGFAKRIWRLREGPFQGGVLLLAPDETRLRHARRLLAGADFPVFLVLEREAVLAGLGDPIWRPPSLSAALDLRDALAHTAREGFLPSERAPLRATFPQDLDRLRRSVGPTTPLWLLPAVLKPAEKRALDLIADWPWIAAHDLQGLLGVSRERVSNLIGVLENVGLAGRAPAAENRLVATARGLAMLARRDRASVGLARKRWSPSPLDAGAAATWRGVRGGRSRQLLRNLEHTAAVHGFIATLAGQARRQGWEVAQLDPPRRASRYYRDGAFTRSVHPDAFGVLRRGEETWLFFLEWERRAVRPSTMAARLAPYLRYYASHRPLDDHGIRPAVLVVLRDEIAATHFARVARREMARAAVDLPLRVSNARLLRSEGPLGHVWRRPGESAESPLRFDASA